MRPDQVALAAELLNMSEEAAAANARDVRDEVVYTYSNVRGLGSILVGPDLSVMFFPSNVFLEQALDIWDTGKRTPRESFNVLHTRQDGTRRPQDER